MQRRVNIWSNIDWLTVTIYLVLVILGWINIYAAVFNEDNQSIFDLSQRYGKQIVWISTAFVIAFIIFVIDINFYPFFAYFVYGIVIFALVVVLIFGTKVHGATSWLEIGNFRIQPSEFAKIATALALARYLSSHNVQINTLKSYIRIAVIILLPASLILLQNDTGSALVYFAFILVLYREGISEGILLLGFFVIVLFILALVLAKLTIILLSIAIVFIIFWFLNRRFKIVSLGLGILILNISVIYGLNELFKIGFSFYLVILIAIGISGFIYIILAIRHKIKKVVILLLFFIGSILFTNSVDFVFDNFLEPHQQKRINVVLGLESDPYGVEYNVNQSKIAIGSGGIYGKGFLKGTQTKFDFVPEQSTDFIFCTIGEEWGFAGTLFVVFVFTFFLYRLVKIAERQRSSFSRMYGYGVISVLFFHITINIGMTIGLVPVIGIPLPFFSYGGSSLLAFTILLFILLRLDASRLELLK
ncbi:MAG: rod shape-determining protein RodA [Bacteroidales bacterium]|jgi:rod shape determining protein RodA|nr:rod shape-determining protein RodA [Bacteroidales bacterium]